MDGIILVKKPSGITSHDVVYRVRRKLGISKIGHTGTLDPMASGLMLLTIGKATKILPFMEHYDKEYIAEMQLGYRTDTLDCTGKTLETKQLIEFSLNELQNALKSFVGDSLQVPPMYSAKKVNGQKLYDMARNNQEVERKPVKIHISEIELLDYSNDKIKFRVVCSTGTYVRVLIEDIAKKLNNLAVMTSLVRSRIDSFSLDDAYEIDELNPDCRFTTIYDALKAYPYIEYQPIKEVYDGKRIQLNVENNLVMIVENKEVVACYEKKEDGYFYSKRGLW